MSGFLIFASLENQKKMRENFKEAYKDFFKALGRKINTKSAYEAK